MLTQSPTTKYFNAAVSQLLCQRGRGSQVDLARKARMSPSYLNDLLSGRKPFWPDMAKDKIAQAFGLSVAEMLEIGEQYVKFGVFWPHGRTVSATPARSALRMARIYQLAAEDSGLKHWQPLFTAETIVAMFPQLYMEYHNGALQDAHLYEIATSFCLGICAGAKRPLP